MIKYINFENKIQNSSKSIYENIQVNYMAASAMTIRCFLAQTCLGIDYLIGHYGLSLQTFCRLFIILTLCPEKITLTSILITSLRWYIIFKWWASYEGGWQDWEYIYGKIVPVICCPFFLQKNWFLSFFSQHSWSRRRR